MIKFDLHIHSFASRYKESKGIVDASTIERAPILLQKLNDADVSLFSITDHNRFWPELYEELDKLIATDQFPNVQGLLAGVEFDVQIDPEMPKCHIITIFDAKNRKENYQKIREAIIFSWVMHEQAIIDSITDRLDTDDCKVIKISLTTDEINLRNRLTSDIARGIRTADVIERSLARIYMYSSLDSVKVDTSNKTIREIADEIIAL